MSPNPRDLLDHLRAAGYHPRSDKHSNTLAIAIANDLAQAAPAIRDAVQAGSLVYDVNFDLHAGRAEWNVDLVLGTPASPVDGQDIAGHIVKQSPARVQIAIEIKSVMTEHRKAVKNRKRDLEAHHEHVHNYSHSAIAGGVFVINAAAAFKSPLRPEQTEHRDPRALVEHCINELRSVSHRANPTGYGLDAKAAIVVEMDNVDLGSTRYVTRPPAPQTGDQLHYDGFIQSISELFRERYG